MKSGTIVYEGKSKSGKEIIFRYPTKDDLQALCDYINTLSKERTFLSFQGDSISLKEEKKYLNSQLRGINNGKIVQLLAFSDGKIVGVSEVNLKERNGEKHIGIFGITLAKDYRNQGIGSLLMEKVIEEAKNKLIDLKIIILDCFSNNDVAKNLYIGKGFREYGNLPKGFLYQDNFVDRIYMYKEV